MRVDVPWGTGTVPVDLEDSRVAGVLGANVESAEDPEGVLRAALEASTTGFTAFLEQAPAPLLVVVNDATRSTPTAEVLRVIRKDLEAWLEWDDRSSGAGTRVAGAVPRELSFVVDTGAHRAAISEVATTAPGSSSSGTVLGL